MNLIIKLEDAVSILSTEFGIPLITKEVKESTLEEGQKMYLTKLHSGDTYFGTFCLVTEKGKINSAAYTGNHPIKGEIQLDLDTTLFHCDGFGKLSRLGRMDMFRYELPFLGPPATFDVAPVQDVPGLALRYVLESTQN